MKDLRVLDMVGLVLLAVLGVGILLAACSGDSEPAPTPTAQPAPTTAPQPTPAPDAKAGGVTVTLNDAAAARYIVEEKLRRLDLPIDAIGETSDVTGAIAFDADGSVNPDASRLAVGLSGFVSDEDRRDRWVRTQLFDTGRFPNAELAVTGVEGLAWPLPESGEASFRLIGDLTIQEVTGAVEWDVTARFDSGTATGRATTVVTFEQFDLPKPTFAFILSVADEIRLEIDIDASID